MTLRDKLACLAFNVAPTLVASMVNASPQAPDAVFKGHQAQIVAITSIEAAGSERPSALSIDANGKMIFWDIASRDTAWEAQVGPRSLIGYSFLTISPDSNFATALRKDSPTNIYDLQSGSVIQTLKVPDSARGEFWSFGAFSPDSRRLAISTDEGNIRLFDLETGLQTAAIEKPHRYDSPHGGKITFSKDGLSITAATYNPNTYTIYNANTLAKVKTITSSEDVEEHRFSDDMRLLAVASKKHIFILNTETLERVYTLDKPPQTDSLKLDTYAMAFDRQSLNLHIWYVYTEPPFFGQYQIVNTLSGTTTHSSTIESPIWNPPTISGFYSSPICLVPSGNLLLTDLGGGPSSIAIWKLPTP